MCYVVLKSVLATPRQVTLYLITHLVNKDCTAQYEIAAPGEIVISTITMTVYVVMTEDIQVFDFTSKTVFFFSNKRVVIFSIISIILQGNIS